jgi:hypothetical protein
MGILTDPNQAENNGDKIPAVVTEGESDFLAAVRSYQVKTGRRFPALSEYYKVLLDLGYSKPA